jgi:hypothetical protein
MIGVSLLLCFVLFLPSQHPFSYLPLLQTPFLLVSDELPALIPVDNLPMKEHTKSGAEKQGESLTL